MYSKGIGVEKDRVKAFVWLSLAAQHGVGSALAALETTTEAMSAEEKAAGATQLDAYRATSAPVVPSIKIP